MKVAIAGLGNMGSKILPPICGSPLVSSVVGFDPDPASANKARLTHAVELAAAYEDILRDPAVRLVFIASPNHLHFELATAALEAGKAVLCEKPMATRVADAEKMVATAERLGGFLQIGFELRYSQLYVWAKERIDAGLVGQIVNTQCNYICSEFIGKNSWRTKLTDAGGMFGEKLCHYVDLPRWWVGSPVRDVLSVCAPNVIPYYQIRDNYHTTCRYENGAVSHLTFMMAVAETEWHDPLQNHMTKHSDDGHELRYLLQGTKGVIETDCFSRRFRRWEFTDTSRGLVSTVVEDLTWEEGDFEDNRFVHNTTGQSQDVIRRVAEGRPPFTDPRDSLETMKVVFAAEESADTGEFVILDSQKETAA